MVLLQAEFRGLVEAANEAVMSVDASMRTIAKRLLDDESAITAAESEQQRKQERDAIFAELRAQKRNSSGMDGSSPVVSHQARFRGRRYRAAVPSPRCVLSCFRYRGVPKFWTH